MKVKVSEATNIQLNWIVAKAQGIEVVYHCGDCGAEL